MELVEVQRCIQLPITCPHFLLTCQIQGDYVFSQVGEKRGAENAELWCAVLQRNVCRIGGVRMACAA